MGSESPLQRSWYKLLLFDQGDLQRIGLPFRRRTHDFSSVGLVCRVRPGDSASLSRIQKSSQSSVLPLDSGKSVKRASSCSRLLYKPGTPVWGCRGFPIRFQL
jgi:hypothetical protein